MKALIVDDCDLSRQLLIICVGEYAETDIARNGKEALDLARAAIEKNENYNLICLDLNMPLMDGHETMQAIRRMETEAGADKAVIFMITSSNCPDDMIKAITLGECDDYMMKPVMRKTFLELLKKHNLIPAG
jgi:two-component system chemotaxis response regulator CheY